MGIGCSSDTQSNQHSLHKQVSKNPTVPVLIRTAHCDPLRVTAKELKSEWFERWLKIEKEIHRLECRNVLSQVKILKSLQKHLRLETENVHKSQKEIKKKFKSLTENSKDGQEEENLETAFRDCLKNYCNVPNLEKVVVLSRFRTNHEKFRLLQFSTEFSEKILKEEQENLEVYFMLYARQNEILCDIFDNKYGSKAEYQLTLECDKAMFNRISVHNSLIKFSQVISHLDLTKHQLEFAISKTAELSRKSLENYDNEEFIGLQQLNSTVAASYLNYSLANIYLPKDVALPSSRNSSLNSTLDEDIIVAIIEAEKDQTIWERVLDSFNKFYTAIIKDFAWTEEIFRQYLIPDFEISVKEYVQAKEKVQLERYHLIKERIFKQTNEYLDEPNSESNILPYKEIYSDESILWSNEKIPFCPVEPNEIELEKEDGNNGDVPENSDEETQPLEIAPDNDSILDISLITRDQIYERDGEMDRKKRRKTEKIPAERSSFMIRSMDQIAPNYNDLFSDIPRSSPEGYSGSTLESAALK